MADLKISQLPVHTTPAAGDLLPIVNAGVTKQITFANFTTPLQADIDQNTNDIALNVIEINKKLDINADEYLKLSSDNDAIEATTGSQGDARVTGIYNFQAALTDKPTSNGNHGLHIERGDGSYRTQIVSENAANDDYYIRKYESGAWRSWRKILHDGNTTLGDYVLKAGDTMTGTLTLLDSVQLRMGTGADYRLYHDGTHNYIYSSNGDFRFYDGVGVTTRVTIARTTGNITLAAGGGERIKLIGNAAGAANTSYLSIYASNGTTRQAYIGIGSVTNSDLYLAADVGNIRLRQSGIDYVVGGNSGARWNVSPVVNSSGVMEIGKYLDFHNTSGSTGDNDGRITLTAANSWTFSGNITATQFRTTDWRIEQVGTSLVFKYLGGTKFSISSGGLVQSVGDIGGYETGLPS